MERPSARGIVSSTLLLALALAALPLLADTYNLTIFAIFALLALSLGFIWGYGGILCFGQAASFGGGAYVYAIAATNFGDSTFAILLAIVLPALLAAMLGAMMFYARLSDVYLGVITLAVTLILFRFMNATAGPDYVIGAARLGGFNGMPGFPALNVPFMPGWPVADATLYAVTAGTLTLVYMLLRFVLVSHFGRVAIAIRENEQRIELMGYDARSRKTLVFAIGGAIAGLAGALYACWAEIVTPQLFGLGQSAEIIIWCIVGGRGTLIGPIAGAMALASLKFMLGQQARIDNSVVFGLILVLSVLLLPRGVIPALAGLFRRVPAQARHGISSAGRVRVHARNRAPGQQD